MCSIMTSKNIEWLIKEVADRTGMLEEEVKSDSDLIFDLFLDELDIIELVMAIEHKFNIAISDDDVDKLTCVQDLYKFLD